MAHVRVERFRSGDCQHDSAKHHERMHAMEAEKAQRVPWIRCPQDSGLTDDFDRTQQADDHEPHERDRSEYPSNFGRAFFLEEEQREDDDQSKRDRELAQKWLNDSKAFGRAEN